MGIHRGETDKIHQIQLPSSIQQVYWNKKAAGPGASVVLQVFTRYVGNGSEVTVELSEESGKKYGKVEKNIMGNRLSVPIKIPDEAEDVLYATVELPKHGLQQKSNPLRIFPRIEISDARWDKKEARRGDKLKLAAELKGVPDGIEAEIEIWEHDADEAHDLITTFQVVVKDGKIEAEWEYEYNDDTDDIPSADESEKGYSPPEYFFRVKVGEVCADSELLQFKDWIEIELVDENGKPVGNEEYKITFADGTEKKGKVDENGKAIVQNVPPGRVSVEITDVEGIGLVDSI